MRLKLREAVLHCQQIMTIVVLLQYLLVQTVFYSSLQNIRIVRGIHLSTRRAESRGVLPK